ncbi:FUSC family protein [Francisella sp. 19X1-34]|uniref:FUSC family protein n=1 Tax=Francisella sp. 19X1-34 TaxID=3087177 RepID=UPI002E3495A6|nr:FUSC family protein [Francisella sp. 19X1-34]MED7789321.1 FUSC family protein [Francisella sp. 19X1-34]
MIWAFVFGIFLPFYRFGNTKLKQIQNLTTNTILVLIAMILASFISLINSPILQEITRTILVFLCLYSQRYFNGGRILVIFLIVYVLLFFYLDPFLQKNDLLPSLNYCLIGLLIGFISTSIFTIIMPNVKIKNPPVNKDSFVIKQAIVITALISTIYISSRFIHLTNPAWVCYSIVIVSTGNYISSLKTSLHRLTGTIIGAIIGILLSHFIFDRYPLMIYSCFIFIFLTYLIIHHNYGLGIAFATIWLVTVFYFLKSDMTVITFTLARIYDTLLGIIFGIIAELILNLLNKKKFQFKFLHYINSKIFFI